MPAIAPVLRLVESDGLRLLESDGSGFAEATVVLEEPDEVEELLLDTGRRVSTFLQPREYRERNGQMFTKFVVFRSAETCGVRLSTYAL